MKNEKRIDTYFGRVKQNPPLMNIEKVHQILREANAEVKVEKGRRNLLKFTIMTTLFAIIVSAFLFWPRAQEERPNPRNQNPKDSVLIVNIQPAEEDHMIEVETNTSVSSLNIEQLKLAENKEVSIKITNQDLIAEFNNIINNGKSSTIDSGVIKEEYINKELKSIDQKDSLKNDQNLGIVLKKEYPEQILDSTLSIVLTKDQLEAFGFGVTDTSIELFFHVDDKNMATIISDKMSGLFIDVDGYNNWEKATMHLENPSKIRNQNLIPMLITDELGQGWLKLMFKEEKLKLLFSKNFSRDHRTLIPIVIKKYTFKNQPTKDLLYWFLPTEEFFNRLPREISEELLTEYEYITTEDKSALEKPECKYFDECKNTLDVSNFKVFPNPANSRATVSFTLNEPIDGRITLVDLAGRERQVLQAQTSFAKGSHRIDVDVSNVPEGIYLITLFSDKGIQTQRFIVSR